MNRVIALWPNRTAPYTEFSPEQVQPSITEYLAENAKSAMVVCPGGGYGCKVDHEKKPIADIFTQAGISAYVLDYRVAPCHYEAPLADALRAIRVVRMMGYEKVGIIGFSAGGHLTCSAATLFTEGDVVADDPVERVSSRPDAFVASYPVVSFESFRHQGSLDNLLGKHHTDEGLLRRFSAELNVTDRTPPGFVWHSCADGLVPVQNSLQLGMAMANRGIPFAMHIFQGGYHGAGVAGEDVNAQEWSRLCVNWLREQKF